MAINCYTGLMGSGKTYQVVKEVIVKQYKAGRRIVTNINGLNPDKIKEYCIKKYKITDESQLGEIVLVHDDDISKPNFFPIDNSRESIAQKGDFIVVDEAWRQFGKFSKLTKDQLEFFAKHRHYTSEKGVSMDFVVIVQDISMLHRELLRLIEFTFRTKKLKALGLDKKFVLNIYEGHRLMKSCSVGSSTNTYDPEIFPLYKSYASGDGKEVKVDDRTTIFSKKFIIIAAALPLVMGVALYKAYSYFHPAPKAPAKSESTASASNSASSSSAPVPVSAQAPVSKYKIAGVIDLPSKRLVFLQDKDGNLEMVYPRFCTGTGLLVSCKIDNDNVTYYSNLGKDTYNNKKPSEGSSNEKTNHPPSN